MYRLCLIMRQVSQSAVSIRSIRSFYIKNVRLDPKKRLSSMALAHSFSFIERMNIASQKLPFSGHDNIALVNNLNHLLNNPSNRLIMSTGRKFYPMQNYNENSYNGANNGNNQLHMHESRGHYYESARYFVDKDDERAFMSTESLVHRDIPREIIRDKYRDFRGENYREIVNYEDEYRSHLFDPGYYPPNQMMQSNGILPRQYGFGPRDMDDWRDGNRFPNQNVPNLLIRY